MRTPRVTGAAASVARSGRQIDAIVPARGPLSIPVSRLPLYRCDQIAHITAVHSNGAVVASLNALNCILAHRRTDITDVGGQSRTNLKS